MQIRKRINRIIQIKQTHIYFFVSMNAKTKKIIYNRQNRRNLMFQFFLNSNDMKTVDIVRENDDEDDENDENDKKKTKSSKIIENLIL